MVIPQENRSSLHLSHGDLPRDGGKHETVAARPAGIESDGASTLASLETSRRRRWQWGTAGAALLVASASVVYFRHRGAPGPTQAPEGAASGPSGDRRWLGFAAGTPAIAPEAVAPVGHEGNGDAGVRAEAGVASADLIPAWASPAYTPEQLRGAMDAWRRAIIERNAETVLMLDRAFATYPGRFGPELLRQAEADPEPRVRAFSTRVLGKLKNAALEKDFERLLADASPYVRQNAAWALGELVERPDGREAAEGAVVELRHLQDSDPAIDVRAAATNALRRLQE
jgi:HEAT repeats